MSRTPGVLYTVGHSTRPIAELIGLLEAAGVTQLVDVRKVPRSRRHPQFERAALAASLGEAGIEYRHAPALGGFRQPHPDSPNTGWELPAFRGYADYMATPEFAEALAGLEELAHARATAVMCAEAQWWRCHRRLISDALVVRGWRVLHLGLGAQPVEHEVTPFAVVAGDGSFSYPPAQTELRLDA
jgi:uncharacterized protein (DUF488 family)